MHRFSALIASLALGTGLFVVGPLAAPALAASVDVPVHEWNMCGAACNGGNQAPANVVVYAVGVSNPRPWSVSLTEVCFTAAQYTSMVNAMDDYGYHPDFYVAKHNVGNCNGVNFGNVVFAVGALVSVSRYEYPSQEPGDTEERGVVCSVNSGYLGNWRACSTHMDNSSWADNQEVELYNVALFGGCTFSIYGGDFNLEPQLNTFDKWRTAYDEIDEVAPWRATISDGRKIDYLWARDCGAVSSPFAPVVTALPDVSDHFYYSGRFRITFEMRHYPGVAALCALVALSISCSEGQQEDGSSGSGAVVPFELLTVAEFPEVPPDSPWWEVSVALESVPETVDAGGTLEFVVALTNRSGEAIDPGVSCPGYFANLGESSESAVPVRSLLNCEEAATIGPGETERFAMVIEVPAGIRLDSGTLFWRLEPVIAGTSSRPIAIVSS